MDVGSIILAREYLRVSYDGSGRLRSPDEQHGDHEDVAQREGWTFGDPYLESEAVSASRYARKARIGWPELIGDLRTGAFKARILLLWESSRGSRRVGEWVELLDLCEKRQVLIYIFTHRRLYDPTRPRDRKSLLEEAVDAESASGETSDRTRRALAANVAEGRPHGRIPYGCRREYDVWPSGKRRILGQFAHPETAPVVRFIFHSIAEGHTLRWIARALNGKPTPSDLPADLPADLPVLADRGLRSPEGKPWSAYAVRRIAVNPVYAALRSHHGKISPGNWEALVSQELYWAVHALLTDPSRRRSRPGRTRHLLAHLATCHVCGGPMQGRGYKPRPVPEYWCRDGNHAWVPEAALDKYVKDLLLARMGRPDLYPQLRPVDDVELQAARDELAAATAHHRGLITELKARRMSPMAFGEVEPAALEDVAAADARVKSLEMPPAVAAFLATPHDSLEEAWERATIAARRDLIRAFFESITVDRHPDWEPGKWTPVTLAAVAPDGTLVRNQASAPYRWAGLANVSGEWIVAARGMTDDLRTARRYARRDGDPADWVVVPFTVDPQIPDRVHHLWREGRAS